MYSLLFRCVLYLMKNFVPLYSDSESNIFKTCCVIFLWSSKYVKYLNRILILLKIVIFLESEEYIVSGAIML